jgi:hypothetical protein
MEWKAGGSQFPEKNISVIVTDELPSSGLCGLHPQQKPLIPNGQRVEEYHSIPEH